MFTRIGILEIGVILFVVLLLFGPGRITNIAGEIGKSIRSFREGLLGGNEENEGSSVSKSKNE